MAGRETSSASDRSRAWAVHTPMGSIGSVTFRQDDGREAPLTEGSRRAWMWLGIGVAVVFLAMFVGVTLFLGWMSTP